MRYYTLYIVKKRKSSRRKEENNMKKFLVSREAIIYLVVEAENEADAIEKAFENYGLEWKS